MLVLRLPTKFRLARTRQYCPFHCQRISHSLSPPQLAALRSSALGRTSPLVQLSKIFVTTPRLKELSTLLKERLCTLGASSPMKIYLGILNTLSSARFTLGFKMERQRGVITQIATMMQASTTPIEAVPHGSSIRPGGWPVPG